MKRIVSVKVAAAVIAGLGLAGGAVSFAGASAGTVGTTGRNSNNEVNVSQKAKNKTKSTNNVGVANVNPQTSVSGNATVKDNRNGGNAKSGAAGTDSSLEVDGTVKNNSPAAAAADDSNSSSHNGTIDGTGRNSNNEVNIDSKTKTTTTNNNNVGVVNYNTQVAQSGNATVKDNRTGGDATSGNATTKSTTSVKLNVQN